MPPLSLLIKPVSGACNLRCTYCFYMDEMDSRAKANYGRMDEETVKTLIRRALTFADGRVHFAFQGGEPTLAGADFYRFFTEEVNKQNRRKLQIHYALQTNGYELTDDLLNVLKENQFLLGVSLDGTRDIHDSRRLTGKGEKTYDRVLANIDMLRDRGIDYNILCVVDDAVADDGKVVYQNLRRHGYLQFIPCLDPLEGGEEPVLDPEKYRKFLIDIFDEFEKDLRSGNYVSVNLFDSWINMLYGRPPATCGFIGVCAPNYLAESDGSVYPCDFYALDEHYLGNLKEDSLYHLEKTQRMRDFLEESKQVDEACKTCPWLFICRGGCKRERQRGIQGPLQRNRLCEGLKTFFDARFERMKALGEVPVKSLPKQS